MSELKPCEHKHTGSCSPDGVYLYVRCMDCGEILTKSKEGERRLNNCPGYDPGKTGWNRSCVHCGFDFHDHNTRPDLKADDDIQKMLDKFRPLTCAVCGELRTLKHVCKADLKAELVEAIEKIQELADSDICDGNCDDEPPHIECKHCKACRAINEIGEIVNTIMGESE